MLRACCGASSRLGIDDDDDDASPDIRAPRTDLAKTRRP